MSEQKVLQRWPQTSNNLLWNNLIKEPKQQSRNKPSLVVFHRGFFLHLLIMNNEVRKWAMNKEHTGEERLFAQKLLVATQSMSVFKGGDLYLCCGYFVSIWVDWVIVSILSLVSASLCICWWAKYWGGSNWAGWFEALSLLHAHNTTGVLQKYQSVTEWQRRAVKTLEILLSINSWDQRALETCKPVWCCPEQSLLL